MSHPPVSPLLRAWYKWKMLRLPWRRQFLVGLDLNGNTYWEFLDRGSRLPSPSPTHPNLSPVRWRRIVRYPRGTHNGDVVVPPAWHQWLRHTRPDPPSLREQQAEVARQERIRLLAAQADARWEAKPRAMEGGPASPSSPEGRANLGLREPPFRTDSRRAGPGKPEDRARLGEMNATGRTGVTKSTKAGDDDAAAVTLGDDEAVIQREETWKKMQQEAEEKQKKGGDERPDPWKQAKGGPSETWQPQAWQPAPKAKK
ncbi:uncharacterized protein B0T15DRAFT_305761 [Chaetomium strumarium]|uniref:NADH dehydrogenase [ubiquinone] 1 alpha subcomplex subunit n=1 Tax=Chaetomium strumarium TaxID=1170767 RepID=A0AAJ0LYJ4_9PEZI|nr:hypothetical protein B0T15DRAFT_305761 [Chaetomium strumarium]